MTVTKIKDLVHAQPFIPFTVHTADGEAYEIPHPDFVALSKTGRLMHVFLEEEKSAFVDIALITRVTLETGAAA